MYTVGYSANLAIFERWRLAANCTPPVPSLSASAGMPACNSNVRAVRKSGALFRVCGDDSGPRNGSFRLNADPVGPSVAGNGLFYTRLDRHVFACEILRQQLRRLTLRCSLRPFTCEQHGAGRLGLRERLVLGPDSSTEPIQKKTMTTAGSDCGNHPQMAAPVMQNSACGRGLWRRSRRCGRRVTSRRTCPNAVGEKGPIRLGAAARQAKGLSWVDVYLAHATIRNS